MARPPSSSRASAISTSLTSTSAVTASAGTIGAGTTSAGESGAGSVTGASQPVGYRRSTQSPRGQARRRDLLERISADLASNGLVDFSLRRAARAAGTTHKVLLYHFDGVDDLLVAAVLRLRERRIEQGILAAMAGPAGRSLADRVRAIWPVLVSDEARVLDQAIGLAMYDPGRYAELGRHASAQYLPSLLSICPPQWSEARKYDVAHMILAVLRGFLVDARTSGQDDGVAAGFRALVRALEREEAAEV